MTRIRALVVGAEPIARARVVSMLSEDPDVDVVGEYASGSDALAAIGRSAPDLVFLDIQMAEMDGIALARSLGPHRPAIVFVTAYDEYALTAFEIHALDYLLKPFSADRFRAAVAHAREHLSQRRVSHLGREVLALLPGIDRPQAPERLVVRSGGRIYFVPAADIDWCEASGNYVHLHVGAKSHLVRETMSNLEARLDASRFVRIHRSAIVNVDRIQELRSSFNGEYVVVLKNGAKLTLSRTYRDALQSRIGKVM